MQRIKISILTLVVVSMLFCGGAAASSPAKSNAPAATAAPGEVTFGVMSETDSNGKMPDFIQALGTNGVVGYIRADDLVQLPANPEAAAEYMATLTPGSYRTIPLYSHDGVTVIGEFKVTSGQ